MFPYVKLNVQFGICLVVICLFRFECSLSIFDKMRIETQCPKVAKGILQILRLIQDENRKESGPKYLRYQTFDLLVGLCFLKKIRIFFLTQIRQSSPRMQYLSRNVSKDTLVPTLTMSLTLTRGLNDYMSVLKSSRFHLWLILDIVKRRNQGLFCQILIKRENRGRD
ncbi:hypothetical protein RF11_03903 [Thelohanellus kitauei]|uniref:Uncharacterized protein n=1 Tax=Thelohanellus kitauei TaxID=669202 RepID=A0A0C2MJG6_THEKT|nr:hypothetical protein RF11_03903 [Thelohanellus kitauei]